jgi:hypothetical protein
MATTLTVRPAALLEARRVLLRHARAVSDVPIDPPDTGATSVLTREVFGRVAEASATVAADLETLAAGLARVVDEVTGADAAARSVLDVLRRGLS